MDLANETKWSLTPGIPPYDEARAFLKAIKGSPYSLHYRMMVKIREQEGTPKNNIDWTNPDIWIPERLDGEEKNHALKIWLGTKGLVNPRHTRGCWYLAVKRDLIYQDEAGKVEITAVGDSFLNDPNGEETIKIDRTEGLLNILQSVSEHSPGRRGDILPSFVEFCNTYTNYRSESVYKSALYDRMVNLIDRGLVEKLGSVLFQITDNGTLYLQSVIHLIPGRVVNSKQVELNKLSQAITREARDTLMKFLSQVDPYKFEHLVGRLLEEMGYGNIKVTSPTNDKGVDVIADIELGISSVHEVVQVKRHAGTINRTVVDLLRGSLHRFSAFRGTIITTGTFAAGAKRAALEQNAAPITLIDGKKLLDLLMEYEIGISKKPVAFYEFDNSKLQQFEEEQEPLDIEK